MKIVIHTVYENVDEEFLDWWVEKRFKPVMYEKNMPATHNSNKFKYGETVSFKDYDPTKDDPVMGTTSYQLIRRLDESQN